MEGAVCWDFSGIIPDVENISYGSQILTSGELSDIAIQFKRNGKYGAALAAYMILFDAYRKYTGRIPVGIVRGLFKVLICVNSFALAFNLSSTLLADMQQSQNVDGMEQRLFDSYFRDIASLSIAVIDYNDMSNLCGFCSSFSGANNYVMQRNLSECKEEFRTVRSNVRQILGQ